MSYLKKLVGGRITALRERIGWTQIQLSIFLDVEPPTVSRWESGKNLPEPERLEKFAAEANVPPTYFFKDDIPFRMPDPTPEKALEILASAIRKPSRIAPNQEVGPEWAKISAKGLDLSHVPARILARLAAANEDELSDIELVFDAHAEEHGEIESELLKSKGEKRKKR